jgi:arylformamidase
MSRRRGAVVRIVDISRSVGPTTPVYPGDPPVLIEPISAAGGGDSYALSRVSLGSHTGTHVDPPAHFIPGAATVDAIPLEACIGPALVLDVSAAGRRISAAALASIPDGTERLLLRTGGPALGGPALTAEAARLLADRRLCLVGSDTLSVAPAEAPGEVHRILLDAGAVILEGLDLAAAPAGPATLLCLPLKIADGDGAPARAVLLYDA